MLNDVKVFLLTIASCFVQGAVAAPEAQCFSPDFSVSIGIVHRFGQYVTVVVQTLEPMPPRRGQGICAQ